MNQPDDWQAQQEEIGGRLRDMRTAAGLTGKALADLHGWQQSKVSRIENGQQVTSAEDIRAWVVACGADMAAADELVTLLATVQAGHRGWKRRMRRGPAAVQAGYNRLVAESATIRHFETIYVPGLLQTADYAHGVLAEAAGMAEAPDADIAAAVATRMQRQQMLYDSSKRFEFLLTEAVLRLLICPAPVMRVQLDRLQTVIGLPNIKFGVLPFGVPLRTTPQNSFQLYDSVAVVETFVGEWTHPEEDSAVYLRVMERLWQDAVVGDAARRLVVRAQEGLREVG